MSFFISLFLCSALSSAPVLDDCRVRLRYVAFDQMSESEHLLWLNCAFEALKKGEAKHLQLYEKWSGSKPNYRLFKKEWEVYTLCLKMRILFKIAQYSFFFPIVSNLRCNFVFK